jgi:ABC-type dipeptide/oligopeptide/nickel transport system permease component
MQRALRGLFFVMPFLFGIGFIAPVTAELINAFHVSAPIGLTPVAFGLVLGGLWGLYATIKGSWV